MQSPCKGLSFSPLNPLKSHYNCKSSQTALQDTLSGGGEYIDSDTHLGVGGRFNMAYVMENDNEWDMWDLMMGLDVYVPARISNGLTAYAGVGGTLHFATLWWDEKYSGTSDDMEFEQDGVAVTESAFVGVRWRYLDHAYVFAEYRREFGKIDLTCQNYHWQRAGKYESIDIKDFDMGGNRVVVGLGILF